MTFKKQIQAICSLQIVRTLSVLTNSDNIDIVVLGLVSLDGLAWSDVGKEGEGLAEHQVH